MHAYKHTLGKENFNRNQHPSATRTTKADPSVVTSKRGAQKGNT